MGNHCQLIVTYPAPRHAQIWAQDTLEQAETRLRFLVNFFGINQQIKKLDDHTYEARCGNDITRLEIVELESEKAAS